MSRAAQAAVLACMVAMWPAPAPAQAGFSVNPTHLELRPSQSATALTIANYNASAVFMQVRVYRWEHKDNRDVLEDVAAGDSDAPIVTPPLFRLSPHGGSQVVRIGFAHATARLPDERQWRVIVEEVPQPPLPVTQTGDTAPSADAAADDPPEAAAPPLSVAIHIRVSLPLLQRPEVVRQDLEWDIGRSDRGVIHLIARNLGTVTERLDAVRLDAAQDRNARLSGPLYVFPGESRTFELGKEAALPAGNIRLSVQGTPRPLTRELVLSAQ